MQPKTNNQTQTTTQTWASKIGQWFMAASSPGWRKDFANNSKQKSALWFDYSQEPKDRFRQSLHLIPEPARSSEITSTNTGPEQKEGRSRRVVFRLLLCRVLRNSRICFILGKCLLINLAIFSKGEICFYLPEKLMTSNSKMYPFQKWLLECFLLFVRWRRSQIPRARDTPNPVQQNSKPASKRKKWCLLQTYRMIYEGLTRSSVAS